MTSSRSRFIDSLGQLTAPAHADDFYEDLWRRIERETQRPKPPRFAGFPRLMSSRRFRFATLSIATVAAAVVVAVIALSGLPGFRGTQPEPATAASVGASIGKAMQSWRTFQAVMILRSDMSSDYPSDPATARIRVTLSSDGGERWDWLSTDGPERFRQLDPQQGDVEAYDPDTQETQIYLAHGGEDGRPSLMIARNAFPTSFGPLQPYAATARAVLAEQDPNAPMSRVLADGRPAWRLEFTQPGDAWKPTIPQTGDLESGMTVPRGFGVSSHVVITVDAATGLPLRMVGRDAEGRIVGEMRLQKVKVNAELAGGAFRLHAPDAQVGIALGEAQAVSLSEAESLVGSPLLVPSRVPAGYSLATVCVVHNAKTERAVALFYRRGLDLFVVAEGPQGFEDWGDGLLDWMSLRERVSELDVDVPDLPNELSTAVHKSQRVLREGALAGRAVSTAISALWAPAPWRGPSLWTTDAGSRLVITGTLTRAELVDVAESLEPWDE